MRTLVTAVFCAWHSSTLLYAHDPPPKPTSTTHTIARRTADGPTCQLKLSLIDAKSGEPLPGVVQVLDHDDKLVELPNLLNRGQGIEQIGPIHNWWVLAGPTVLTVPAKEISVDAFSGLETERAAHQHLDLTGKTEATLEIPLTSFHDALKSWYIAGNTHLHLMKMSRQEADRYLSEVPLADGLWIVFLSYLERAEADLEYTSNNMPSSSTIHETGATQHATRTSSSAPRFFLPPRAWAGAAAHLHGPAATRRDRGLHGPRRAREPL
ncbi:MAG: hypothetical protein KF708_21150 [Pirellulales bacterium]|nr:hypothetical protein [Pirellulales bacterium]